MNSILIAFSAISTVLDSASGNSRVTSYDFIDKEVSDLNLPCLIHSSVHIVSKYACTQSIWSRIR